MERLSEKGKEVDPPEENVGPPESKLDRHSTVHHSLYLESIVMDEIQGLVKKRIKRIGKDVVFRSCSKVPK